MKSKNLYLGVLILFVGVIALLASLDVFEFHWRNLLHLWPMVFIITGISILPVHKYLKTAILMVALALGCVLYSAEIIGAI